MLAEREIAPSSPMPPEASWAVVSTSWDPSDASKYYRARYYDPRIGRFISEDPIGFAGGNNFYAYAGNNPVNLTDPTGLFWNEWSTSFRDFMAALFLAWKAAAGGPVQGPLPGRDFDGRSKYEQFLKQPPRPPISGPSLPLIIAISPCFIDPNWWFNPATDTCEPRVPICTES